MGVALDGLLLFLAFTTLNGVESSLEKDSSRLAGGGLGDDDDELTLLP